MNISRTIIIKSQHKKSDFYPENLEYLLLEVKYQKEKENTLKFSLIKEKLIFEGTQYAFSKLGQSILNYFDEPCCEGDHLHLDYFEGNDLLAPTNCHVILMFDS